MCVCHVPCAYGSLHLLHVRVPCAYGSLHLLQRRHHGEGRRLQIVGVWRVGDGGLEVGEQLERVSSVELLPRGEAKLFEDGRCRETIRRLDQEAASDWQRLDWLDELASPCAVGGATREKKTDVRAQFTRPLNECRVGNGIAAEAVGCIERCRCIA